MSKIIYGAAGAILLTALACSTGARTTSTSDDPGASAPAPAVQSTPAGPATSTVGGTIMLTSSILGSSSSVGITLKSAVVYPTGPDAYSQPRGEFLVPEFSITVIEGSYAASPFNFAVVAKDGTRSQPTVSVFEPALPTLDMQTGQTTAGKITFDVPKSTTSGSKIAIVQGFKDVGYWAIG
jgi:hypothetical protein